ncbi:MAG TPA: DUF4177 domain-containing protein [Gaiellaceae bacterium]|jgi:hypothetical protein|nr:DUF4177 domain-containing protein [Gaiellaceae bacterium]
MQRWEYRVISLQNGRYTATLNEYGHDGWELVSVVSEPRDVPVPARSGGVPMPGALGRIGEAAEKLNKLGEGDAPAEPSSVLLWVLRRPLGDGD